jgi:hypothetical protein
VFRPRFRDERAVDRTRLARWIRTLRGRAMNLRAEELARVDQLEALLADVIRRRQG